MRPTSWTIGILTLALAGTASALPLPFDPASQFSSGFAWADDPTGTTTPELVSPATNAYFDPTRGFLDMDPLGGSPWSFELQAGGINHQGVTPLAFTNLVIPAARYSASVPVMVTPLAGGLFHALMAPGTVLATVEMGPTFYLVDVTGEIGAQMHGQQSATAAVTAFECVVNAAGEGSCDLTIGPGGFDIVGFTELYTLQHSVHVVTAIPAPEPSMLGLVALTGLGVVRRRRPR